MSDFFEHQNYLTRQGSHLTNWIKADRLTCQMTSQVLMQVQYTFTHLCVICVVYVLCYVVRQIKCNIHFLNPY